MMEGFGVNTFRLINNKGEATFVKFHWRPKLGRQSTCWDVAVKIAGADPDYHRRDLFEAIEGGNYPEWSFGVQLLSQKQADALPFDILDATKVIPEELVPIQFTGRMVLDRNPDNLTAFLCPHSKMDQIFTRARCMAEVRASSVKGFSTTMAPGRSCLTPRISPVTKM